MANATGGYAATAAVLGGFWPTNGVASLVSMGHGSQRRRAAMIFGRQSMLDLRQIARALDGVVPGSNATKTVSQVEANSELGGKRAITTKTLVNRNTVAGDVTNINADILSLSSRTYTTNPVANLDGNPLGTR